MFYKIIVVYNQEITSLQIDLNCKIVICDNSTNQTVKSKNNEYAHKDNAIIYYDMKGNKGLSYAYNFAINQPFIQNTDWIVILDQDTENTENMIEKYQEYISNNPHIDVICPIVRDKKGIMSPSSITGLYFKHTKKINLNRIDRYSYINSGMCIKKKVYINLGYNEDLFLDYIDHDFIKSIKKHHYNIGICEKLILFQSFSGVTRNTFEQDKVRYEIFVKDAAEYYKKWYPKRNFRVLLLKRAIKLSLIHKSLFFLKKLVNGV